MIAPQTAFDGLRVLDLTQVVSGPVATMLMGDFGAEIIKIEPPGGEAYRRGGPPIGDGDEQTHLNIVRFSRNKKSVVLDLKTHEGAAVLRDLLVEADVLVENFRPGVLARLGFDYQQVRELNPRLIYASISGFGHSDLLPASRSSGPAYALTVEALSGLTHLAGQTDGPPTWMGFAMADIFSGVLSLAGIGAALYQRELTGRGRRVDVAMADGALLMNDLALLSYNLLGQVLGRGHYAYQAPWGVFEASDGFVAVAVMTQAQWAATCDVIGRPNLADDPALSTGLGRSERVDDLIKPAFEAWSRSRSRADVVKTMTAAGVPTAPVNTAEDLADDAGMVQREMMVDVLDPIAGPVKVVGNPIKLEGSSAPTQSRIPRLGEHTDQVLTELLGYDPAKLADLRTSGALG